MLSDLRGQADSSTHQTTIVIDTGIANDLKWREKPGPNPHQRRQDRRRTHIKLLHLQPVQFCFYTEFRTWLLNNLLINVY